MNKSAVMRWLKRGRLVSAVSRSTGDLLKALQQPGGIPGTTGPEESNSKHHHSAHHHVRKGSKDGIALRLGVLRSGYLYVLTDAGFWFRMWVVLRVGRLETFYEPSDSIPMETVSLSGGKLSTPRAISSECPEDVLYPMHVCKEGHPSICLAAENPDDQKKWSESLRGSLQASSLHMEGLNLEGHGRRVESNSSDDGEGDRGRVYQKLDLLDELLVQREKGQGTENGRGKELYQKMNGLEQWYERVLISEQREALRRATHLRQRKISTQLKADTIREQLRSSRKSRPKSTLSLRENPREENAPCAFYEVQLRELTDQLNLIHSSLGREEAHSEVATRKLDRKHDHEIHRLHSDMDLLNRKMQKSASQQQQPRIQLSRSQEDCRVEPRRTGNIPTPKSNAATSMLDLNRSSPKHRLSPLRLLGHLVDAAQERRRRRNASEELLPQSRDSEEAVDEADAGAYRKSKRCSDSSNSSSGSSEKLRTEIDPSALAEIQAFEQLTEQVLGSACPSRSPSLAE